MDAISRCIAPCFQQKVVLVFHSRLLLSEHDCVIGLPITTSHILQHKRGGVGSEPRVAMMLWGQTALCHSPHINSSTTHTEETCPCRLLGLYDILTYITMATTLSNAYSTQRRTHTGIIAIPM